MRIQFILLVALLAFSSCKKDKKANNTETKTVTVTTKTEAIAQMGPKSGSKVSGTVKFKTLDDGKVLYNVAMTGLEPNSQHAIHIHEFGDCSSDDGKSAGGHWNPTGHNHGKLDHGEHFHYGDIGNLQANEDGTATLSGTTDKWTLLTGDNSVIGKSVIVHAKADDFVSQPSGAAGTRIACGVIE